MGHKEKAITLIVDMHKAISNANAQVDLKSWQWDDGKEHLSDEGSSFKMSDMLKMAKALPFDTDKLLDKMKDPVQEKLQEKISEKIQENMGVKKSEETIS